MVNFKFELDQEVIIAVSNEQGLIIARAQYRTSENQYLLRYKNNEGRAVEEWWGESALYSV